MPRLRSGERVRCVRGQTVDTGHFVGGDLRGTRGTVMSSVYKANGKDGPKGEERVAVALEDTGIVSVPVAHLERARSANRRAVVSGIDMRNRKRKPRPGRTKYKSRGGKLVRSR